MVALLVVLVTGCDVGVPQVAPAEPMPAGVDEPPPLVEPPDLVINGEPGRPVTWCWDGACVDGFIHDPRLVPAIAEPFEVELPAASRIEGIYAIGPGAPGARESIEVPFAGTDVGDVPEGAIMLNVFIRFGDGGDASYYWALNRPVESP